jgi:hypothetical protein
MHFPSSVHPRRLISILTVSGALGLAGCGGSSQPAATVPSEPAPADDGKVMAPGTSGLAGLDWGASAEAVLALYPRGTADEVGVVSLGAVEGRQAITRFSIGADGLSQVDVEWTDGFVSMEDCATTWSQLRAELDGRFGPSQADNLAAYWELTDASVTLACNPNDSDAGVLSQSYAQRQPE